MNYFWMPLTHTHTHTVNAINKSLAEPNLQMSEEAADSLSLGLD